MLYINHDILNKYADYKIFTSSVDEDKCDAMIFRDDQEFMNHMFYQYDIRYDEIIPDHLLRENIGSKLCKLYGCNKAGTILKNLSLGVAMIVYGMRDELKVEPRPIPYDNNHALEFAFNKLKESGDTFIYETVTVAANYLTEDNFSDYYCLKYNCLKHKLLGKLISMGIIKLDLTIN